MKTGIQAELTQALLPHEKVWANEEKTILAKNILLDLVEKTDPAIIGLLLGNDDLKRHFFVEVNGVLVFKLQDFRFFLDKHSVNNSYTKYANRIGLTDGSRFLKDSSDIVLDFPFKDCVLNGGQSTEEGEEIYFKRNNDQSDSQLYTKLTQKRQEIFFNQTLAFDEIDRLFDAKAFSKFSRYTADGKQPVGKIKRHFDGTPAENLIIKGNNLIALHSLAKQFRGRIDLIYIDPPFNTEHDSFKYNDKFSRSTWLTFMKNRLEIAKDLLSEKGTIYVHIDHNEGHYLKVLMDSIFGEKFFRNEIVWKYSGWNKKLKNNFERRHDVIFMYGKSENQYFASYFQSWGSKEEYIKRRKQKLLVDNDGREYVLSDAGNGKRTKIFIDEVLEKGVVVDDVWDLDKLNNSSKESVGFTSQKREVLLERIISASCPPNGIVLDYHLGSGTTAAVAHKMNRQYIGIEQMDYIETLAVERLKKVIDSEQNGISKAVNWQGGGEFVYAELAPFNETAKQQILACEDSDGIKTLFDELCERYFLKYNVSVNEFSQIIEEPEFQSLPLDEQKQMVLEMLDLNQMYVSLSEMDDEQFAGCLNDDDKALSRAFYQSVKNQAEKKDGE
ncbi:DNA methyltransferase [Haemophilus influenzae]|uniref:DNA methyltransferase n=1 Tax=Haemophilus influenzae TaxID=727 RepID=UPI000D009989|nr:site-specific DNA-methyltransferase [Haemophilus influenzae]MCK8792188.1 site-specific DNA-methyltransferase [Haemophilus influenzae]MCK8847165.1 site-specific DNA-methyltransferase [Haemophilus influenzae]PRI62090.1 Modification methylase RsrI [Haemophilus influenzae]PRI62717.1 Modification methylase RsrI [Haemophilus influenzae]PRK07275.1 Modification methylase RsrI [Haemophilus influenzae]